MALFILPLFKSVVRNQFVGIVVGEKKGKVVDWLFLLSSFCFLFPSTTRVVCIVPLKR
jgi:hypothetical protein